MKFEPDSVGVSSVPTSCSVFSFQRKSSESDKLGEAKGPDLTWREYEDIRILQILEILETLEYQ